MEISQDIKSCFYCDVYASFHTDYPINQAKFELDDDTPRCYLHWKYTCSSCTAQRHFNGISWCQSCELFTCLYCGDMDLIREKFFGYKYYYSIDCLSCDESNPALDYAEYTLSHPFQLGQIQPENPIQMWVPIGEVEQIEFTMKFWGRSRILALSSNRKFTRVNPEDVNSVAIWDNLASQWVELMGEEGDYNHRELIIPAMMDLLEVRGDERVLDVACGNGHFTRKLADLVDIVEALDISKMIDYAIQQEEADPRGITYHRLNLHDLGNSVLGDRRFDKITCNMALMDIPNLQSSLKNISSVLNQDGIFVFSITHPVFSWPTAATIKLPRDSERNEDKISVIDNYFDERPTLIEHGESFTSLYYPRTLETYINTLIDMGFSIERIVETKADEDLVLQYPRDAYMDHDLQPPFLVVKCRYRGKRD